VGFTIAVDKTEWEPWVEEDPERLGGEPTFRGTRVPVKSLFDHLAAGDTVEIFLDDFPGVTREQVRAVLRLAGLSLSEQLGKG
jgi:uncharacterized protein (DUF433 family)